MDNAKAQDRSEERLALLRELATIGMDLARDLPRQAARPGADAADIDLKFSRIARAVRQTLALEARFEQEGVAWTRSETLKRGVARKRQVRQIVEQTIEAECTPSDAEDLFSDLEDCLWARADADFADAPLNELVAAICRDLGVTPDPTLWEADGDEPVPPMTDCPGSPGHDRPTCGEPPRLSG